MGRGLVLLGALAAAGWWLSPLVIEAIAVHVAAERGIKLEAAGISRPGWRGMQVERLRFADASSGVEAALSDIELSYRPRSLAAGRLAGATIAAADVRIATGAGAGRTGGNPGAAWVQLLDFERLQAALPITRLLVRRFALQATTALGPVELTGTLRTTRSHASLNAALRSDALPFRRVRGYWDGETLWLHGQNDAGGAQLTVEASPAKDGMRADVALRLNRAGMPSGLPVTLRARAAITLAQRLDPLQLRVEPDSRVNAVWHSQAPRLRAELSLTADRAITLRRSQRGRWRARGRATVDAALTEAPAALKQLAGVTGRASIELQDEAPRALLRATLQRAGADATLEAVLERAGDAVIVAPGAELTVSRWPRSGPRVEGLQLTLDAPVPLSFDDPAWPSVALAVQAQRLVLGSGRTLPLDQNRLGMRLTRRDGKLRARLRARVPGIRAEPIELSWARHSRRWRAIVPAITLDPTEGLPARILARLGIRATSSGSVTITSKAEGTGATVTQAEAEIDLAPLDLRRPAGELEVEDARGELTARFDGERLRLAPLQLQAQNVRLPGPNDTPVQVAAARLEGRASLVPWFGDSSDAKLEAQLVLAAKRIGYARYEASDGVLESQLTTTEAGRLTLRAGQLRVARLNAGVHLGPLRLPFTAALALPPKGSGQSRSTLHLGAGVVGLLGGQARIDGTTIRLGAGAGRFALTLDGLELNRILALQQQPGTLQGSGTLDGEIPVVLEDWMPAVTDGRVRAREPGGTIRFRPSSAWRERLEYPGVELALDALTAFRYTHLSSKVAFQRDGTLALAVTLQGRNPAVRDGRPVHFNLSVTQNLLRLLQSLRLSQSIGEQLERRIEEKVR